MKSCLGSLVRQTLRLSPVGHAVSLPRMGRKPIGVVPSGWRTIFVVLLILALLLSGCGQLSKVNTRLIKDTITPPSGSTMLPTAVRGFENIPSLALSTPQASDPWVEETLKSMSEADKLGLLILTGVQGSQISPDTCQLIEKIRPAGIFFHIGNVIEPGQLRQFTADLQDCASRAGFLPLLTAMDHEGEAINYFQKGITLFPTELAIGATGDPEFAARVAQAAGRELAYSGINLVFGPVADVLTNPDNRLMSVRTFGNDPQQVSQFVAQAVKGYFEAGLTPVLKHFPGHGGSDARYATRTLPVDESDPATLETTYLPPFWSGILAAQEAGGMPVVMLSHVAFPRVTGSEQPASLSKDFVHLLRDLAHYDGVLMSEAIMQREGITSDIGNGAPTFGVPDAALQAFQAGVDLLLLPEPDQALLTYDRFTQALSAGEIQSARLDESVQRILRLKAATGLKAFPLSQAPEPDWQANARLAQEVGKQAVTLFRGSYGTTVPISADVHRMLVIGPDPDWSFYPALKSALNEREILVEFVYYSSPWDGAVKERELVQTLPDQVDNYDFVLLFTWQAYIDSLGKDAWQMRMGKRLAISSTPLGVVALKSPLDLRAFPKVNTYLSTMGMTEGAMQALIDTLLGRWTPTGKNPLPGWVP